jgi:single-stranded-DNA-specific exonuclease
MTDQVRWIEPQPINVPQDFRAAIAGHPLVAETLYRRGFRTVLAARAFMDPDVYQPTSADELPDAEHAYLLLTEAINNHRRILVWGDFDVDGQTSTTILVEGLSNLGADLRYHIPIRAKESHGISRPILKEFLEEGFDLLLTCDTGISEHENIQLVKDAGIPVIVTDHHSLGPTLPPADAVVNPQRLPEEHPLRTLPGAGVVCKLIEGLYAYLQEPFPGERYYELAALGIVADVALLRGDTRWLLQKGLIQLRHTERLGLQTLFNNAGLNSEHLNETHIGFQIAPRMNAVGRLSDANPMVEFLTTTDPGRARTIGATIEALNAKRQMATRQVTEAAEKLLLNSPDDRHAPAIILHYPDWPGGVVGIVAARLVERYHKPAILLTGTEPIHGSARSIDGINITEAIGTQADLLTGYGGHPMAAGMALQAADFASFKKNLLDEIGVRVSKLEIVPEIEIDQTLSLPEIDLDFVSEIERLAPFGPGNPPLNYLLRDLRFVSASEVGQTGEHRQVIAADAEDFQQRFIWWNGAGEPLPEAQFDLICRIAQSDYKGSPQINAEWIDFQLSERGREEVEQRKFTWLDMRQRPATLATLNQILEDEPDVQVWAEGLLPEEFPGSPRQELHPGKTLLVWTIPPSASLMNDILRVVSPEKALFFAADPGMERFVDLTQRVAGLAKYVINHREGQTTLTALTAACAAERETVTNALRYWEAKGAFQLLFDNDLVTITIDPASTPDPKNQQIYMEIVQNLLTESRAFRQFYRLADLENLINP